jgi:small subunit ribosomal protein S27Ae
MAETKKATEAKEKKTSKGDCYNIKGNVVERKNNFCPKCGAGVFMAEHKDRQSCGKCGFTQWKREEKK